MPPPLRPLEDIAQQDVPLFQTHLLRAYAPMLPWYKRPQLSHTPYTLDNFLEGFRQKMVSTLKPPEKVGFTTHDLSLNRTIIKHLCYRAIDHSIHRYSCEKTDEQLAAEWSQDARANAHNGNIKLHTTHHPYYDSYKAKAAAGDILKKQLDIPRADRDFATWYAQQPLANLVRSASEFTTIFPDVRVALYASKSRSELQELMHGKYMLDDEMREEAVELMRQEWIHMKGIGGTDSPQLQELFAEYNVLDCQTDARKLIKRVPQPSTLRTVEDEAKISLLYEYIGIIAGCDGHDPVVHQFLGEWSMALMRLKVAVCDRPTLGLSMLSMMALDPEVDIEQIRQRL